MPNNLMPTRIIIRSLCPEKSNKSSSNEERSIKNDGDKKHCDMIFLSNLEEVVLHTSSSKCLMRELLPETKNTKPVEYDKYLEFLNKDNSSLDNSTIISNASKSLKNVTFIYDEDLWFFFSPDRNLTLFVIGRAK